MFKETSSVKISNFIVYLVVYKILKRDFNVFKQVSLVLKETISLYFLNSISFIIKGYPIDSRRKYYCYRQNTK